MKTYWMGIGFLASAITLLAQGSLDFSNYKPSRGIDAPVTNGGAKLGDQFLGQLYAGPATNALSPVGSPVPFRNEPGTSIGSGYIIAGKVLVTNVALGATAFVQLRAWDAGAGATYEAARVALGKTGRSATLVITTGSDSSYGLPPVIPMPLAGLQGFSLGVSQHENLPPVSSGFGATTPQNQVLQIPAASLMAPVTDPEGGAVSFVSASATSTNGALVVANGTTVAYLPTVNFVGADRFSYEVSDALGATNTVYAQIAVLPLNRVVNTAQPPVVSAGGVAFNFTALPGRSYQVQRATSPAGPWGIVGTLMIQPDGSGIYVDSSPPSGSGFYRTALLP